MTDSIYAVTHVTAFCIDVRFRLHFTHRADGVEIQACPFRVPRLGGCHHGGVPVRSGHCDRSELWVLDREAFRAPVTLICFASCSGHGSILRQLDIAQARRYGKTDNPSCIQGSLPFESTFWLRLDKSCTRMAV